MTSDPFLDLLPRLLDLELLPPAIRRDETGRRRVAAEFGDFRGHVPYTIGDDLRFLDWNVMARSGHRVLRRFDGEEHRRLMLVLDLSASVAPRLAGIRDLAMLYSFLALVHLDGVDLITLDARGASTSSFESLEAWPLLQERLAGLAAGGSRGLLDLGRELEPLGRLRGPVVISDFQPEDACREALGQLSEFGHALVCVFPRLDYELDASWLAARGRVWIEDYETGDRAPCTMTPALAGAFVAEQAEWEQRMTILCRDLRHEFRAAPLPGEHERGAIEPWLPFLTIGEVWLHS